MTQTSFDNYKDLFDNKYMLFVNKLALQYQNGAPSYRYYEQVSALLLMYKELLDMYGLVAEEENEEDYVVNFLNPHEMRILSEFANRILNINYLIDFLLTADDVFGAIPSFTPAGSEVDVAETKQTIL